MVVARFACSRACAQPGAVALSRGAQDDAAGLAESHGGGASEFAELDAGVLYRTGGTAKARFVALQTCVLLASPLRAA